MESGLTSSWILFFFAIALIIGIFISVLVVLRLFSIKGLRGILFSLVIIFQILIELIRINAQLAKDEFKLIIENKKIGLLLIAPFIFLYSFIRDTISDISDLPQILCDIVNDIAKRYGNHRETIESKVHENIIDRTRRVWNYLYEIVKKRVLAENDGAIA